jgi:hypothetical protein
MSASQAFLSSFFGVGYIRVSLDKDEVTKQESHNAWTPIIAVAIPFVAILHAAAEIPTIA